MQSEGTLILHLDFAARQDHDLGRDLLKLLKSGRVPLSTFNLAIALSIARISRFEQIVLDFLLGELKSSSKGIGVSSAWLIDMKSTSQPVDISQYLLAITTNAKTSWDFLVPSLVNLAVVIIDQSGISLLC